MGIIDFNVGRKGIEKAMADDREEMSFTERMKFRIEQNPKLSLITGIIGSILFVLYVPSFLYRTLPDWIATGIIILFISEIPAYYSARRMFFKYSENRKDEIVVHDPSREDETRRFWMEEGKFKKDYEFEGKPLEWTNHRGNRVFSVIELDQEEEIARGSWMTDMSPAEIVRFRENWEAQKIWNDKQRRWASKIRLRWDQMKSRARAEVTNDWIRDLEEAEMSESIRNSAEDLLPDDLSEELEDKDLLSDLDSAQDLPEARREADMNDRS